MKTITFFATVLFLFIGITFSYAGDDELIGSLTKDLKITKEQAMGGAGALFNYAKEGLSEDEFEQVSKSVPDMSGYLNAIPSLGGGKSKGIMGQATQALVGMPAVTAAFDKLGLSQDMVGMFTPILVNYVDQKGGKAVGSLLQKVLTK
jgi:hypothetical protein